MPSGWIKALCIWGAGLLLYVLFLGWHGDWGGRLSEAEIAFYMERFNASPTAAETNNLADIEAFMRADDGEEFLMLNLVKYPDGTIAHPDTSEQVPPNVVLQEYFYPFMSKLIGYGGHPAIALQKTGGYVDFWGAAPEPDWNVASLIRYPSRRALVHLASDPSFEGLHKYKLVALEQTLSFPTSPIFSTYLSPRWWVAMLLGLLCALSHLAVARSI